MTTGAVRLLLRPEFRQDLERRLNGLLGRPGSEGRLKMEQSFQSTLSDGQVSLDRLPEATKRELARLQKATQDLEGVFVKNLLKEVKLGSGVMGESGMGALAADFLQQAVSDSVTRGGQGLGIARLVFGSVAEREVRSALVEQSEVRSVRDDKNKEQV